MKDERLAKKIEELNTYIRLQMSSCRLCPRECGADRNGGETGRCGAGASILAARASLHMWEEPCISGEEGSGTVFFSGCSLGCCYCQNSRISEGEGFAVSEETLAEVFLKLQRQGANNINLVTAGHFLPQVGIALCLAKEEGLHIPIVYNSSGYEKAESLRLLEGLIDVWLPDLKYADPTTAQRYSSAADYPQVAKAALAEMVRQNEKAPDTGRLRPDSLVSADSENSSFIFDERGILQRGVVVRHLLLPGHVKEAEEIVSYLWNTYADRVLVSLMSQYTPMPSMKSDPLLGRTVTKREYEKLLDYALSLGIEEGFFQEGKAAKESFIPEFDGRGILDL